MNNAMLAAIRFPNIDPVIFDFGVIFGIPLAVRWYSLLWIAGCVLAWLYVRKFVERPPHAMTAADAGDFLTWGFLATFIGGRLGYVSFYNFGAYLENPLAFLRVWEGGMSFHGGLIGVIVAVYLFARSRKREFWAVSDAIAVSAPIGLFSVRIANFINGELLGRVTDVPWGIVFPRGGPMPRHPSQLYEAALEGILLFALLHYLSRIDAVRERRGLLTGVLMLGYAASRVIVETVRQPDAHIGFFAGGTTMGQWLSVPVLLLGIYLVARPAQNS